MGVRAPLPTPARSRRSRASRAGPDRARTSAGGSLQGTVAAALRQAFLQVPRDLQDAAALDDGAEGDQVLGIEHVAILTGIDQET